SRRSVLTLRDRVAYIGAKFGSAIMTSCPRTSRPGDPFAVGRGLDQDPGARSVPEHGGEPLALGADAPLDDLTVLGEDVDLAFPLVDIDANMVHGWPLPSAALTARCSCGAAYATTSSGRPASFIPSTLIHPDSRSYRLRAEREG